MSSASASDLVCPDFSTMNALTISVRTGSGLPITAASATAGGLIRQSSISPGPPDTKARRGDDVVIAADEGEIAVLVDHALVAGGHPVADELFPRGGGVAPVFQKHHRIRPLHRDLADLAGLHRISYGVDHRDGVPGNGLTD